MSPGSVLRSPARSGQGGPNQRNSAPVNRRKRDDTLLHKTVVIQQGKIVIHNEIIKTGPHKGYIGIVKDCTDTTARVELHTNCKTITINRENLVVKNDTARMDVEYPRTPMYGEYVFYIFQLLMYV